MNELPDEILEKINTIKSILLKSAKEKPYEELLFDINHSNGDYSFIKKYEKYLPKELS